MANIVLGVIVLKIKVEYNTHGHFEDKVYTSRIRIYNDKDELLNPFFYKELITDSNVWINATNLLSEAYLKENKIEFIIDVETKEIIPLGLIKVRTEEYVYDALRLSCKNSDELYKVDKVIKNIIEAIKIKYKSQILLLKCYRNEDDTFEF